MQSILVTNFRLSDNHSRRDRLLFKHTATKLFAIFHLTTNVIKLQLRLGDIDTLWEKLWTTECCQ